MQHYGKHAHYDPKFRFFLWPLLLICFVASVMHVVHARTPANMLSGTP